MKPKFCSLKGCSPCVLSINFTFTLPALGHIDLVSIELDCFTDVKALMLRVTIILLPFFGVSFTFLLGNVHASFVFKNSIYTFTLLVGSSFMNHF